jgi:hypothetical protein
MNIIKIFSNSDSKASFLAGVIVSTFAFLLLNATTGVTGEKLRDSVKKPDYNYGKSDSGYTNEGEKDPFERIVKYLPGGEILVLDEKGEVIAKSPYSPIKEGPLTEHRTVTFVTVTENGYDAEAKDQKTGFLDFIIKPAMATTVIYERHYTIIDGDVVSCNLHRKSPAPHKYIKSCM